MRRFFKIILSVVFLGAVSASAFTEGTDYVRLEKPLNVGKDTLVKVFSYACPACYRFDKGVTTKLVNSLDGIKFIPMHLSTKGDYGETASKIFAVLAVKDEAAGVSLVSDDASFKKGKMAIYKAAHDKGETWRTKDGGRDKAAFLKTALEAVGMSEAEYEAALNTPAVQEKLAFWEANAYEAAKIQGIPAYVVSGKYLVNASSASSIKQLAEMIKELVEKQP